MWNWIVSNIEPIGKILALGTGAGGLMKIFYNKMWQPYQKTKAEEKAWRVSLQDALKELKDNGGGSMKDISKSNQKMLLEYQKVFLSIGNDLSSIKNTQEALFKLMPYSMFTCDNDGRWVTVNESICRMFGATVDQLLGLGWQSFIIREHKDSVSRDWDSGIENDNEISIDFTIKRGRNGEDINCGCIAHINRGDSNEIISIFGIVSKK